MIQYIQNTIGTIETIDTINAIDTIDKKNAKDTIDLLKRMQNNIDCIYMTFPHCVFSVES